MDKAPVLFLETIDKKGSGWFLDGTKGTYDEQELNSPSIEWIPNSGFMAETVKETVNGKEIETLRNVEIRFIKNYNNIRREVQDKANVKPTTEDQIQFEKSYATVTREGNTAPLYDYLSQVFYNENAPNRPSTATPLFRVVKLDEDAEVLVGDIEYLQDALEMVLSLREKTGNKENPYKYNENRIDALCELFNVFSETYPRKHYTLTVLAQSRSKFFVETAARFEQVIETEVLHALQLNVIAFDANSVGYKDDQKVIYNVGAGSLKQDVKIKRFADYLKTPEGNIALTELRAKVELARNKTLS